MPFWKKRPQADTEQRAARLLPALDDTFRQSLRSLSWPWGSGRFPGRHGAAYQSLATHFTAHRPYVPGDDPRHIDQRLLARSGKAYVKTAKIESNLDCLFLLDATASMAFDGQHNKFDFACRLAWMGAQLFLSAGDAVGLGLCGQPSNILIPPATGKAQQHRLKTVLAGAATAGDNELIKGIHQVIHDLPARGVGIILSDFIAPMDPLLSALEALSNRHAELILVQILTGAERHGRFDGPVRLLDPETGDTLLVNGGQLADAYAAVRTEAAQTLDRFARDRHALYLSVDPGRDRVQSVWQTLFKFQGGRQS